MRICHFLVYAPDKLVPLVISLDNYSHTIYVPIRAHVIEYAHIPHRYWYLYENI